MADKAIADFLFLAMFSPALYLTLSAICSKIRPNVNLHAIIKEDKTWLKKARYLKHG